jgi:hypothetical protein
MHTSEIVFIYSKVTSYVFWLLTLPSSGRQYNDKNLRKDTIIAMTEPIQEIKQQ